MTMIRISTLGAVELPKSVRQRLTIQDPDSAAMQRIASEARMQSGAAAPAMGTVDQLLANIYTVASQATGSGDGALDSSPFCQCAIAKAAEFMSSTYGVAMSPEDQVQAQVACATDEATFTDLMSQVGVDVKGCAPWWKKPAVWIGGVALLGAGALLFFGRK